MNPFNLDVPHDGYLAECISKINKSSVYNLNDALNNLLEYLPNSCYQIDYKIILKTILPHLDSSGKETINKIIYFLVKKLGIDCIKPIQAQWLYFNIDPKDKYAKKLISDYIEIDNFSAEFKKLLKFEDYLKDLECFIFLIKNSRDQHYFDVSKLSFTTYLELDLIYDILSLIRDMNPMNINIENPKNDYQKLSSEIFSKICLISNDILISRKYKILFDIFDYFDDKIYEESAYLTPELLKRLINKNIIVENIAIRYLDQLSVLIPHIKNLDEFILRNLNESMCLFQLYAEFNINSELILNNIELFKPVIEKTIRKHFLIKVCPTHSLKISDIIPLLNDIYPIFNGINKIIVSSLINKRLNTTEFKHDDIDTVMEYSINVFPKEYFLSNSFNSSSLFLFNKYPDLIKNDKLDEIISNYPNTKPEHFVKQITNIDSLFKYLSTLTLDKIQSLYLLNNSPKLKIVYLYFLRDKIEQFNVDYSDVFEYFFKADFLKYLILKNNNITNFIKNCVSYIENMPFKNTILYCGYNFDMNRDFYYNLGLPERDRVLKMLLSILSNIKLEPELELLMNCIKVLLFLPISLSDQLKNGDIKMIEFKTKPFITERLLFKETSYSIDVELFKINNFKAQDVILRNYNVPIKYLTKLNPTFLSNEALERSLKTILNSTTANKDDTNENSNNINNNDDTSNIINDHNNIFNSNNDIKEIKEGIEKLNNNTNINFDKYFNISESTNLLDFNYLLESDEILRLPEFRNERISIYNPFLSKIEKIYSEMITNMYSISKLENSDDNVVIEIVLEPLSNLKYSFWSILSRVLIITNNLYISFFIEKVLTNYIENENENNFLRQNLIIPVRDYLKTCTERELSVFIFAFPNLYNKLNIKKTVNYEDLIKNMASRYIDGCKVTYSLGTDSYKLRFVYRVDSLLHEANINVPFQFPFKKPRIEFDENMKNKKFYHKLNELLSRTSKFVEIFLLWKVDIDNQLMGYSECLICYFIMEPKYRTLPEFKCKVCKNGFHDKCIYKWAAESKGTQCPFCRSDLDLWDK